MTRRHRRIVLGLLLAILGAMASGRRVAALDCFLSGYDGDTFRTADVVFVGRIVDLDSGFSDAASPNVLRFSVEASWKGTHDRDVSVRVSEDALWVPFLLRYYVFAQRDGSTGDLSTWACKGPARANLYGDEIADVLADQPRLALHGAAPLPSTRAWRYLAASLWLTLLELWPKSTDALVAQGGMIIAVIGALWYRRIRRA